MGWWGIGEGDDIMGDGPADTMSATFEAIASSREQQGKPKPTLSEVLDALAFTLRLKQIAFLADDQEISICKLIAELKSELEPNPQPNQVSGGEQDTADAQLVTAFCAAFEDIVIEYEDTELQRKPRLRELLACVSFELSYNTDEYLSIDEGISVREIIAETRRK
jgi:hypothetical protein